MSTTLGGEQSPLGMEGYTMLGENFMDYTCHVFSEMRLMVEGAVQL